MSANDPTFDTSVTWLITDTWIGIYLKPETFDRFYRFSAFRPMDVCAECRREVKATGLGNICNDCANAGLCCRCRKNARKCYASPYCAGCAG